MATEHVDITDPEIHEPKNASLANAGQVYVSDGLGSGAWQFVDYSITVAITAANSAASFWVTVPFACKLLKAYGVVNSTFDTNQTVSFEIGGVPITGGTISLTTSGSAAGNIYLSTPSADNTLGAGNALEIVNSGGSGSPFIITITLVFTQTGL